MPQRAQLLIATLLTVLLSACFGTTAGAQSRPGAEVRQDRREIRQDRRQKRDDRRDLLRLEALLNDFDRARRHRDARGLRQVDSSLQAILRSEAREDRREIRQDQRELRRSRREVRGERRERRHEAAQGDVRGTAQATHDLRDDRRDRRDDRRDLAQSRARAQRRGEIRHALAPLYGKYDPSSLTHKRRLLAELVQIERAELRSDRQELREDKRERREDRRERRQDRRR